MAGAAGEAGKEKAEGGRRRRDGRSGWCGCSGDRRPEGSRLSSLTEVLGSSRGVGEAQVSSAMARSRGGHYGKRWSEVGAGVGRKEATGTGRPMAGGC